MTRVHIERPAPKRLNSASSASPSASGGSISGDIKMESSTRAQVSRRRASASAAAPASSTDDVVAIVATLKDRTAASTISGESFQSAAYHRSEYPVGGNFSEGLSVS